MPTPGVGGGKSVIGSGLTCVRATDETEPRGFGQSSCANGASGAAAYSVRSALDQTKLSEVTAANALGRSMRMNSGGRKTVRSTARSVRSPPEDTQSCERSATSEDGRVTRVMTGERGTVAISRL